MQSNAPKTNAPKMDQPKVDANFKHLVRISNTDIDGNKQIIASLRKIKGISFMYANMLCKYIKIDPHKKAGSLTDAEVEQFEAILKSPHQFQIPYWMMNRRNDYETGENRHLIVGDLKFSIENDIRRLKKIKSYRGVRHMIGQPTRGQRTRSNFRRNKGKVMGVQRSKVAAPAGDKKDDKKK